jgi:glyoxylase-like metal-dependent hydrolase (beta-lactamase superfamily II)
MSTGLTKLYPIVQFKKDTWEIDEFDCASIFLLVGTERALLIDTGMGIGDLRGAVEMITDKPLTVVISHGHVDHTANARQFEEIWLHPKDQGPPIPQSLARRKYDTEHIARRQKGCVGVPYTMFHLYPYDINVDLRDSAIDEQMPVIHDLLDGQQFDLGGGRIVTAYECPGHSEGEMVFLDEYSRSLFAGDAINFNLGIGSVPIETTLRYMKKIRDMGDKYDGIYNGHHDFRPLGAPLDDDCLPTIIEMCEDVLEGNYSPVQVPNFWGQVLPLTREPAQDDAPPMFDAGKPPKDFWGNRVTIQKGRNFLGINLDKIRE